MIVHVHPVHNTLANVEYLVACEESGEALAIDPWDGDELAAMAERKGLAIRQVLNTHAHHDHIRGNEALCARTNAVVLCHRGALDKVPGASIGLSGGDFVEVGALRLRVLDTPGHTMSHICLFYEGDPPALFAGDTLFNAGAGNCRHGGHPEALFRTFRDQLAPLPDDTRLYPGHNYLRNNLGFTLSREPGNPEAAQRLARQTLEDDFQLLTLGEERQINTFLRLDQAELLNGLRAAFPDRDFDTLKARFLALRSLRNDW